MSNRTKFLLSEIVDNFDSKRIPLSTKQRLYLTKLYPYYGAQGVIDYVDNFIFEGEYILIAEDGENLRSQNLKICNLVNGKFWVNNHAHIIRAKKGHSIKYIYYYLNLLDFKPFITGSAQPKLTQDNLNRIPLLVHDTNEQNNIANILYNIDSKIGLNNRINAELEAMAKTLYDYWFVQFDFPDANGKPYKSSGGKMVYSKELKREIPEGWEVDKLDRLGTIIGGSTPTTEDECNFCKKTGMPWITPKDLSINKENKFITRGENDVTEKGIANASLNIMPKGTVLLSSRAPIGYLAISRENVTTNQGFKSFVPEKGYSTEFIYYSIKSLIPIIEKNAVGSTFKEVSAGTLKGIRMVYPDMDVIYSFDKKVEHIFRKQDILELENQELSSLRDWLLPMLMNGQVKVVDEKEKKEYTMNDKVSMAAEP